jgi:hypothetical protein
VKAVGVVVVLIFDLGFFIAYLFVLFCFPGTGVLTQGLTPVSQDSTIDLHSQPQQK